mmetsp:Transcript_7136/g.17304  ORF Transcript_7136/g.17304 Transcript_7136/m.17304 type:complete len:651 (-) Transcript_7136:188-2140(-)
MLQRGADKSRRTSTSTSTNQRFAHVFALLVYSGLEPRLHINNSQFGALAVPVCDVNCARCRVFAHEVSGCDPANNVRCQSGWHCMECYEGYELWFDRCFLPPPPTQYRYGYEYKSCDTNCLECTGDEAHECIRCAPTHEFDSRKLCVKRCADGFYPALLDLTKKPSQIVTYPDLGYGRREEVDFNGCGKCHHTCKTCTSWPATACTSCDAESYFRPNFFAANAGIDRESPMTGECVKTPNMRFYRKKPEDTRQYECPPGTLECESEWKAFYMRCDLSTHIYSEVIEKCYEKATLDQTSITAESYLGDVVNDPGAPRWSDVSTVALEGIGMGGFQTSSASSTDSTQTTSSMTSRLLRTMQRKAIAKEQANRRRQMMRRDGSAGNSGSERRGANGQGASRQTDGTDQKPARKTKSDASGTGAVVEGVVESSRGEHHDKHAMYKTRRTSSGRPAAAQKGVPAEEFDDETPHSLAGGTSGKGGGGGGNTHISKSTSRVDKRMPRPPRVVDNEESSDRRKTSLKGAGSKTAAVKGSAAGSGEEAARRLQEKRGTGTGGPSSAGGGAGPSVDIVPNVTTLLAAQEMARRRAEAPITQSYDGKDTRQNRYRGKKTRKEVVDRGKQESEKIREAAAAKTGGGEDDSSSDSKRADGGGP